MSVWIVFEYGDYYHKVVGVYKDKEAARKEHQNQAPWRYIE